MYQIAKRVADVKDAAASALSGLEYFGLASDACTQCIEGLDGILECSSYVFHDMRASASTAPDSKKRSRDDGDAAVMDADATTFDALAAPVCILGICHCVLCIDSACVVLAVEARAC